MLHITFGRIYTPSKRVYITYTIELLRSTITLRILFQPELQRGYGLFQFFDKLQNRLYRIYTPSKVKKFI